MAVDLRHELTRPLALILAAFAVLGWVLFGLSSWSASSVQKAQRLQLVEMRTKADTLSADLAKQTALIAEAGGLEKKMLATREELSRMTQAKADVQSELATAQRRLSTVRRDVSEADRSLAAQAQKLSDLQSSAAEANNAAPDQTTQPTPRVGRGARRGTWTRRGRAYRSYSIMSRPR
ncbi:hypothetical protein [Enterovirga rhinocerotis]|uniref:Uncharacterized protein n=1 Tax=Enterovirga rhinocerotis TaxID=1339210 RepID=A0A4R7C939_9HYPH|nr:hypothetical protein [Enterovirga rhinocerotis]TDR94958.1 hypothetical protein EV668_2250 [Enterovirga rhinocerotis]